jgi:hypothetical protein
MYSGSNNNNNQQQEKISTTDTKYQYLSEFLDADIYEMDEIEEPDASSDPVYQINLKEYISQFFHAFSKTDKNALTTMASHLTPLDQQAISDLLLGKL